MPSLTHPFASVPNPARDALSMSMEAPDALHAGVAGAPAGMAFGLPGGQVHLEMSLEGSLNIPVTTGYPPTPRVPLLGVCE